MPSQLNLLMLMIKRIKRWYSGEEKPHTFEQPGGNVNIWPGLPTEYHWSAKAVRFIVGFFLKNAKFLLKFVVPVLSGTAALIAIWTYFHRR